MKQKILPAGVLLLLIFLLIHPAEALNAARDGMNLWLNTLLPTLLPFLILTGILIRTGSIEKLLGHASPVWKTLFGLSPWGAYAFFSGLLCGYPMGAKLTSDLYGSKKLGKREAEYLLSFSNNPSPAFVLSYLCNSCLKNKADAFLVLAVLLFAAFLNMLIFRFLVFRNITTNDIVSKAACCREMTACSETGSKSLSLSKRKETSKDTSPVVVIDVSIMNGFETMARLGGYILLFSVLAGAIQFYWPFAQNSLCLPLGLLEVTTGLSILSSSGLAFPVLFVISVSVTAFGGLCVMAQTKSLLHRDLSILPCFLGKLVHAVLAGIIACITLS